jgi:hypothetical protein
MTTMIWNETKRESRSEYGNLYISFRPRKKENWGQHWERHEYRYTITDTFSHTAFRTKTGLLRWLKDTGLKIGKKSYGNTRHLEGRYISNCMMDEIAFASLEGRESKTLSNGDYTPSKITQENGINVINYLNPNCNREVLEYVHE